MLARYHRERAGGALLPGAVDADTGPGGRGRWRAELAPRSWSPGQGVPLMMATLFLVVEIILVTLTWMDPGSPFGLIPATLLVVALLGNFVAGVSAARRAQADRRRAAELTAELAWLLLRAGDLRSTLQEAGGRLAAALNLAFASLELEQVSSDAQRWAIPLLSHTTQVGTLIVPTELPKATKQRVLHRIAPSISALLAAAIERERIHHELAKSRDQLALLAEQQKALRRIATLVACGFAPDDVFTAVAQEMAACMHAEAAEVLRYQPDGSALVVGCHHHTSGPYFNLGEQLMLDGDSVTARIRHSLGPARIDTHHDVPGSLAARIRELGLHSRVGTPIFVDGELWGATVVGSTQPQPLPTDAEERIGDFAELIATAIANAAARQQLQTSRDDLGVLATQQAALRRVATLVARGLPPTQIFAAVAEEMARCLHVTHTQLFRYEHDGTALVVASYADPGHPRIPLAERFTLEGDNIAGTVLRTANPTRMDDQAHASGSLAARMHALGARSRVGAPIIVDDRVWGMALVSWSQPEPLPADTEERTTEFAELVGTAIAAATTRAELIASRARIVAAADEARRRIERNLHDGAQQRLISLGLKLRLATDLAPPHEELLCGELNEVVTGLTDLSTELQEISRGIHPAALSQGGLARALKMLARRSVIPVTLDVTIDPRPPESVEVAAYYVVAEALTNTAKHAQATEIHLHAHTTDTHLSLRIDDDGIGGADATKGSGLLGLKDRIEAVGGRMHLTSQPGSGTILDIQIPLRNHDPDPHHRMA